MKGKEEITKTNVSKPLPDPLHFWEENINECPTERL